MKLIIFAGSNYSEYSQGLLEIAQKNGYEVAGVVVRRAFTMQRMAEELNRTGWGIFTKLYKIIPNLLKIHPVKWSGWSRFLSEHGIKRKKLSDLCLIKKIPIIHVYDMNCQHTYNFIKKINPDVVLFGGGGILRETLLRCVKVINCHMGILPDYRGSYPWVWAILNNDINKIGLSAHLMTSDIDAGLVLKTKQINVDGLECVGDVEAALEYAMIETTLEALRIFQGYSFDCLHTYNSSLTQVGSTYYVPHPSLITLADKVLKKKERG